MRLPDPRDALTLIGRSPALLELGLSLVPRAAALLDSAEALLERADALIERIETTRLSADAVVERTEGTVDDANRLVVRAAGLVGSIEPTVERAQRLLDGAAPSLEKLQPTLDRLAETTDPHEVDALVSLVDELPKLVGHVRDDVLPLLTGLDTVGPDMHQLLDLVGELNAMLSKVPGISRVRRRADERDDVQQD
ncbi:hypothetical protein ASD11_02820 [Aeromicrobium sp. Root495]|uniref:hypothetical protein n=1 Tax=Aeromicrobium sp. Root495 TaxID=1736550 RepID=UPI0006F7A3FB|nr:hypothetical protein [Aeromicrobium sp. Root495]KQY58606.1 hypothetical protein ASD11_02820 [Aeromicrobium sp. Root495]